MKKDSLDNTPVFIHTFTLYVFKIFAFGEQATMYKFKLKEYPRLRIGSLFSDKNWIRITNMNWV